MRIRALALTIVVVLAAACTSDTEPPATVPPVALTLELASAGGTAEGEILVEVTLTNGTDDPLTLVRPTVTPNFIRFWVADAAGARMPFYGPHPRLTPLDDSGFVNLGPGESITENVDIGEGFQLDEGTYSLWAEYRNPIGGSHAGERAVAFEADEGPLSESITITVTP